MTDCIFCKIISGELKTDYVFEDDDFIVIKDINPKAKIHLLVIPKEHIPSLNDLTPAHTGMIGKIMVTLQDIMHNQSNLGFRTIINTKFINIYTSIIRRSNLNNI